MAPDTRERDATLLVFSPEGGTSGVEQVRLQACGNSIGL
jgi:hypothetical protein